MALILFDGFSNGLQCSISKTARSRNNLSLYFREWEERYFPLFIRPKAQRLDFSFIQIHCLLRSNRKIVFYICPVFLVPILFEPEWTSIFEERGLGNLRVVVGPGSRLIL